MARQDSPYSVHGLCRTNAGFQSLLEHPLVGHCQQSVELDAAEVSFVQAEQIATTTFHSLKHAEQQDVCLQLPDLVPIFVEVKRRSIG